MLDSGALTFNGDFGASSQILVVGSKLVTMSSYAISFLNIFLGVNSALLLLDNFIEGSSYAVHFSDAAVVDGGGVIVKGNTLRATEGGNGVESSVCVYAVLKNGGY
ncbi:dispersed gene family protein 1 (DGF-1), putative, partial [Trypanosoma cruzi marinkellei]